MMTRFILAGALAMVFGLFGGGAHAQGTPQSAHAFTFEAIDGGTVALSDYAGKAVMVVNTASECGFTKQYEGLQALWDRFRDQGLVVLGVPSDDFGGQEPGTEAEIQAFCETTFGIDFPMTAKQSVKGATAHPFYQWARAELGATAAPQWNFHKYLVGPDGRLVDWFSTVTAPDAARLVDAVEKALGQGRS